MSSTYAFFWGTVIIALGAFYTVCAWFGFNFFFRYTRARREERWFGREAAKKLYLLVGVGTIAMGLLFWAYAAMRLGTERRAKQAHVKAFSANVTVPAAVQKPRPDYQMLAAPVKLDGGYSFRPRTVFTQHSVSESNEGELSRTEYVWRHPDDANQFVAVIITEGRDDSDVLDSQGKRMDPGRGNFINERSSLNFEKISKLRAATAGAEAVTNYDGLVTFGRDALCLSDRSYCGLYRVGYESGRLVELIGLDKAKSPGNLHAAFRSLDRSEVAAVKVPADNPEE